MTDLSAATGSETHTASDPWVSDLHSATSETACESTVGFDDFPCTGSPLSYVELEVLEYQVSRPRWEGKLCSACLSGWQAWSAEEPEVIRVLSVAPIAEDG
jgi:hypothetical protein